jgi:hypothetical protein
LIAPEPISAGVGQQMQRAMKVITPVAVATARHRAAPRRGRRPRPGPARPAHAGGVAAGQEARLSDVRGKSRTSRTVFLGRDTRQALADYLEHERGGDLGAESAALFLAAASITGRRPGGRLSRARSTPLRGRIVGPEPESGDTLVGRLSRPHALGSSGSPGLGVDSGHASGTADETGSSLSRVKAARRSRIASASGRQGSMATGMSVAP